MELIKHKTAHRLIGHLLDPYNPLYVPSSRIGIVKPSTKTIVTNPTESNQTEVNNDNEDGGGPQTETAKQELPLGLSKKESSIRVREIWGGGLGTALVSQCLSSQTVKALLTTQHAADIVVDVARGGVDGVLEQVVGAEMIDKVHTAIIEACMPPSQGEADVLQDYFGSRALKRLVLSAGQSTTETNCKFVDALWSRVLKGRCAELRETHAAKIVAALCCVSGKTGKSCLAELRLAGVADPQEWASTLLLPQSKR